MAGNAANSIELAEIRRLASNPSQVRVTRTAEYDLLGRGLKKAEICNEIIAWIERGEPVKKVVLKQEDVGHPAFELKPRINNSRFYIKVKLCELGEAGEFLLLISAHLDHGFGS